MTIHAQKGGPIQSNPQGATMKQVTQACSSIIKNQSDPLASMGITQGPKYVDKHDFQQPDISYIDARADIQILADHILDQAPSYL